MERIILPSLNTGESISYHLSDSINILSHQSVGGGMNICFVLDSILHYNLTMHSYFDCERKKYISSVRIFLINALIFFFKFTILFKSCRVSKKHTHIYR